MEKKGKIKNWLWLGLDKETAKKYQRKIASDNIRIIKKESLVIALIGAVYSLLFLSKKEMEARGVVCLLGVMVMFAIFFYSYNLSRKEQELRKREVWACMGLFMICAYAVTIYLGTFVNSKELAVTIVCLFVFMPTNFDILPVYNILLTLCAAGTFFFFSYLAKEPDRVLYDVLDSVISIVIGNFVAYEKAKIKWESVMVHDKLQEERDKDILTGIWNRRAFEREVDRLVESRNIINMVVIMLDLDKFKQINDGYGHEAGDAYLQHFCRLFEEFSKKNTVMGRRSGDEFFMFIYNFGELAELENTIRAFYQKLELHPIELPDGTKKIIRVSAGVVWTIERDVTWRELLCAADEALYTVKETGRNNYQIEEFRCCAKKPEQEC